MIDYQSELEKEKQGKEEIKEEKEKMSRGY